MSTTYRERKAAAIAEAERMPLVARGARVVSVYDGETVARIISGPNDAQFYEVRHEDGGVIADWRRDEFVVTWPDPPGTSTVGESTQAFMQRTDPVGYQHCRDAGRF